MGLSKAMSMLRIWKLASAARLLSYKTVLVNIERGISASSVLENKSEKMISFKAVVLLTPLGLLWIERGIRTLKVSENTFKKKMYSFSH